MTCPICDQKPMNCDCTETEKRQWSEIEDLRLTDAEREAIEGAIWDYEQNDDDADCARMVSTLRGLLERLA